MRAPAESDNFGRVSQQQHFAQLNIEPRIRQSKLTPSSGLELSRQQRGSLMGAQS